MFKFMSQMEYLGSVRDDWPEDIIKNEPMFFNSSLRFAFNNGGPIIRDILGKIPDDWKYDRLGSYATNERVVVDSRSHMLMKGWYPCIPGWHHDDVPRSLPNGQPNYYNPEYKSEHLMVLINGSICPTEFALGEASFHDVDFNNSIDERLNYYKVWHEVVEKHIQLGTLKEAKAESGRIIRFDWNTWHQGSAAVDAGWRYFIRISRNTDRVNKVTNEIRKQVQVYLKNPMEGW